jgi:hypothetical protein
VSSAARAGYQPSPAPEKVESALNDKKTPKINNWIRNSPITGFSTSPTEPLRTPADVFAVSKRQLQQPARDRIAARRGNEEAVAQTWSSDRTRDGIARYLSMLKERARQGQKPDGSSSVYPSPLTVALPILPLTATSPSQ